MIHERSEYQIADYDDNLYQCHLSWAVNIAIASEGKYRQLKELKKKKSMSSRSFGGNQKRQRVIYHPVHHNRPPYRPPQSQAGQQSNVRPAITYPNSQSTNAPGGNAPTS